jgi:hypothetical protein
MAGVNNSIHTDMLYWTTSGEVILMSVLGGIGQFFGPFIGAAVIIIVQEVVGAKTEFWPLVIGLTMMVMVLLLPKGLVGEARLLGNRLKSFAGETEVEMEPLWSWIMWKSFRRQGDRGSQLFANARGYLCHNRTQRRGQDYSV